MQKSEIIITKDFDGFTQQFISSLPTHSSRIINNEEEGKSNFKISHAQKAIKEAYIASADLKYIILSANKFELEAQNKLLKVLEEPPKNIIFIIITTSKSNLLPTILSRMSHRYITTAKETYNLDLNIKNLDLKDIYTFLKEKQRVSKDEVKLIVDELLKQSVNHHIYFTSDELDTFTRSIKLLELNSKPINILTTILLTILHSNNKRLKNANI